MAYTVLLPWHRRWRLWGVQHERRRRGANVIHVGEKGAGTFTQSGGSIGSYGALGSGVNDAVGIYIGDDVPVFGSVHAQGSGTYTLGNPSSSSPSSALLVGGVEYVGGRNSGIFNQTGGTNAIVGGGNMGEGGGQTYYDSYDGVLALGFFAAKGGGARFPPVAGRTISAAAS